MEEYKELEILVTKIQRLLSPDAEVLHDTHIMGKKSKRKRQIDVLVKQKIGQYEMIIILDCKDYARPVDVKGVEEFAGLMDDVGANKGALVCPKGFSTAAKVRAEGLMIDLYSPVDTDPHKWQVKVCVPMICDFRSARISFNLRHRAPVPFSIPMNFFDVVEVFNNNKESVGKIWPRALDKWNKGKFPTSLGEHKDLNIFDVEEVQVDNGYGMLTPIMITASIYVQQKLYFGEMPISKISGFKDEFSGNIIANAFEIGLLDPNEIEKSWKEIASEKDAPSTPFAKLVGLIGYSAN